MMSEATEELERRAIELYTDLNEVFKATPEGIDKEFLGKALAYLTTGALLLKATTDVFKAQHDIVNQMKGNTPMLITITHKIRAVLAVAAATIVATVGLGYGQAHAAPGCTASGLSSALGQVATSTGAWLSAHPDAEAAVNTADENAIRTYFAAHQAEWSELQGIASPLRSLRQSCPQQVSPGDVARLYDAMAS
jgi:heme-binding protein